MMANLSAYIMNPSNPKAAFQANLAGEHALHCIQFQLCDASKTVTVQM